MSRTYRKRNPHDIAFAKQELVRIAPYHLEWVKLDPKSKQYKTAVAKVTSDAYKAFKEPGPAWFRNLWTERPQRREAKRELYKYLRANGEYEVMLLPKNPLDYWT